MNLWFALCFRLSLLLCVLLLLDLIVGIYASCRLLTHAAARLTASPQIIFSFHLILPAFSVLASVSLTSSEPLLPFLKLQWRLKHFRTLHGYFRFVAWVPTFSLSRPTSISWPSFLSQLTSPQHHFTLPLLYIHLDYWSRFLLSHNIISFIIISQHFSIYIVTTCHTFSSIIDQSPRQKLTSDSKTEFTARGWR